jgi:hypothetical protein
VRFKWLNQLLVIRLLFTLGAWGAIRNDAQINSHSDGQVRHWCFALIRNTGILKFAGQLLFNLMGRR